MCSRVMQYTNISLSGVEQFVSYLPLSHIATQLIDIYVPMATAGTVWFAQPDAMKVHVSMRHSVLSILIYTGFPDTNNERGEAYNIPRCTKVRFFYTIYTSS